MTVGVVCACVCSCVCELCLSRMRNLKPLITLRFMMLLCSRVIAFGVYAPSCVQCARIFYNTKDARRRARRAFDTASATLRFWRNNLSLARIGQRSTSTNTTGWVIQKHTWIKWLDLLCTVNGSGGNIYDRHHRKHRNDSGVFSSWDAYKWRIRIRFEMHGKMVFRNPCH